MWTLREKRLWLMAGAWLLLIYSTLYLVRRPIEFLREHNLLRVSVALIFLVATVWIVATLRRRRPSRSALAVLALFAVIYGWTLWRTERPEEKLHFIEYGVLAGLIYSALLERHGRRASGSEPRSPLWVPVAAIVLTSVAGWGDEGIQYLLPNRVYDLRDVGLNVAGGALAVGAMYLSAAVEQRQTEV